MLRSNPVILSKGTCPFKRDDEKIEFDFFFFNRSNEFVEKYFLTCHGHQHTAVSGAFISALKRLHPEMGVGGEEKKRKLITEVQKKESVFS